MNLPFSLCFVCNNQGFIPEIIQKSIENVSSNLNENEKLWIYFSEKYPQPDEYDLILYMGEIIKRIETVNLDLANKEKEWKQSGLTLLSYKNKYRKWMNRGRKSFNYAIYIERYTPEYELASSLVDEDKLNKETLEQLLIKYPDMYEIYYRLAMIEFSKNKHNNVFIYLSQAQMYGEKGINNVYGYVLEFYQYYFNVMMGISAFYVQEYNAGKLALDKILFNSFAQKYHNNAYFNYEFYVQPISFIWTKKYPCSDLCLPENIKNYTSLNPSLLPRDDHSLFINLRIVNWSVNPIGYNQYHSPHPKGKFKTKNLLGIIDYEGNWIQKPKLIQKTKNLEHSISKIRKHHVDGFEDCRLYYYDQEKQTCSFITNYSKNNPKHPIQLSLGKMDVSDLSDPKYIELKPILGYGDNQVQKNWLIYKTMIENITYPEEGSSLSHLYAYKETLEAIYFYYPFQRIQIQKQGENPAISKLIHKHFTEPLNFNKWRGSAGPVPFGNTGMFLIIVHEVYIKQHGGRRYLHRFVFLNKQYEPVGCSHLWYIESKDIEYVSTLQRIIQDKKNKEEISYLMGYGFCDSCACISCIEHHMIENMFVPLKNFIVQH
jgi:hypothetical protein